MALCALLGLAACGTRPPASAPDGPQRWKASAPPWAATLAPGDPLPPAPAGPRSFRLVVISDTNSRYGSVELAARGIPQALPMIRGALQPDLVVHNGDLIAAGGRRAYPAELIERMWDAYHTTVTDVLRTARIPLLPVPGNHDVFPKTIAEAYARRWSEPGTQTALPLTDGAGWPRRYSLRFQGTELIVLDAPSGRMSRAELRWLAERLHAARDADMRLVFSHTPLAPLTDRDYGSLRPGDDVYRVLREGHATLLVSSHYEVYYRGWYRDLPVLATGGLGSVCRSLIGQSGCQGMSFSILDVVDGRLARTFALRGRHFREIFDEDTLPPRVGEYYR